MKSTLLLSVLLIATTPVIAAKKKVELNYQPEVKMNVDELLSMPAENRSQVARERGSEFVKDLEAKAFSKEEDYRTRWKSLVLAAQIQGTRSEKTLRKAITSPEWYMRNAALLAYQEFLPAKSKAVAQELLADKALVVRSAAVKVLSKNVDENLRETLWEQLASKKNFRRKQSLFIRGEILSVLAKNPRGNELPLFVKHLNESDARLHLPAITALERVTARHFGQKNSSVAQIRDQWIKWSKTNSAAE